MLMSPDKQYSGGVLLSELYKDPKMFEEPEVLVPNLAARGHLTLLYGAEKSGKTTLAAHIATKLTRGEVPFSDKKCAPMRVLWVTLEESMRQGVRRFHKMQPKPTQVMMVKELRIDAPLHDLQSAMDAFGPDLVVIDSFSLYAAGLVSENDARQVLRVLYPLSRYVQGQNAAVLMLHHAQKSGGFRGSTSIGAVPDVVAALVNVRGARTHRRINPKGRLDNLADITVAFDGESYEYTLVTTGKSADAPTALTNRELVIATLAEGEMGITNLRKAVGGKGVLVDRAVRELLDMKCICRDQPGGAYRLAPRTATASSGATPARKRKASR